MILMSVLIMFILLHANIQICFIRSILVYIDMLMTFSFFAVCFMNGLISLLLHVSVDKVSWLHGV